MLPSARLQLLPKSGRLDNNAAALCFGARHAGEELASPGGAGQAVGRQTFFEAMRAYLLQHFLADADMAAEMHAGRGAAHYDMDEYTVREGALCRAIWLQQAPNSS